MYTAMLWTTSRLPVIGRTKATLVERKLKVSKSLTVGRSESEV